MLPRIMFVISIIIFMAAFLLFLFNLDRGWWGYAAMNAITFSIQLWLIDFWFKRFRGWGSKE